jgi:transcriptional regulator with XRE-family HTH domain
MAKKVGDRIRALRKDRGLTLDALADLAGMTKSYLWELENKGPPSAFRRETCRHREGAGDDGGLSDRH